MVRRDAHGSSVQVVAEWRAIRSSFPSRGRRRAVGARGGAHRTFTRINIEPIILGKKVEEFREAGATLLNAAAFVRTYPGTYLSAILSEPAPPESQGRRCVE
jgi:hypothetical protein